MGGYDTGKNPPRRLLKRNGHSMSIQQFDIESIAAFKQMPSFLPDHFRTSRPLHEKCCICMPYRKVEWCSPDIREMGIRNILDCRSELSPGLLSRLFPLETYNVQKPLFKPFEDVSSQVLPSSRVQNAIQEAALKIVQTSGKDQTDVMKSLNAQSLKIVRKMKASLSAYFIKIAAYVLTKFLRNLLGGIQVSANQMAILKPYCQKNAPLIYLPLHRSHLDYILVTLTLWNFDIRAPYVAAGENLDIPVFTQMMRGLGGFFIRRRLDSKVGQKDILYRAILCQYMTEILKKNEALEFFIEGGRTRTGRAIIPKGGLLSIIVDAFNRGEIPDAYIVPASFGYEKIIDGDFCREQMGLPKVDESFFGAMKAIFRVLFGFYGSIRVDFGRPFSLKEFLSYTKENPPLTMDLSPESPGPSLLECQISYPGHMSALPYNNGDRANSRVLVKTLADHTVFIADHCSSPMSTHLLAFLLLTKYRQGASVLDIAKGLRWIVKELQALHVDVGFCGQSNEVLIYAQGLLGNKLVAKKRIKADGGLELCPNLSIPSVFELSYYANFVTTHFALESILACALMHQSKLSLHQLTTSAPLPETKVIRESVLDVAVQLCGLLHTEFIFIPPCTNLENTLSDLLDTFVSKEILRESKEEEDYGMGDGERQMANRIAKSLEIDEEEETDGFVSFQSLHMNVDSLEARERLHFQASVLGPIMESHLTVVNFVLNKVFKEMSDKSFFRELGDYARCRVNDDLSIFSESCAMLNLKSSVKSLQDRKLLYSYNSSGLVMMGLCDHVEAKESLENYASLLTGALH